MLCYVTLIRVSDSESSSHHGGTRRDGASVGGEGVVPQVLAHLRGVRIGYALIFK